VTKKSKYACGHGWVSTSWQFWILRLYSFYHTTLMTCWGGDLWQLQKAWPQMVHPHCLMRIWNLEQNLGLCICIWDKSEIRFRDFKLLLVNIFPSLTKTLRLQVHLLCEGPNLINSPIAFLSFPSSHCFFSSITIFSFFLKNAPCMDMLFSHLFHSLVIFSSTFWLLYTLIFYCCFPNTYQHMGFFFFFGLGVIFLLFFGFFF